MISNYLIRKIEKANLSPQFSFSIITYISQLTEKFPQKCNQKNFTFKRVSHQTLKICRKVMDKDNLGDCLLVFQFVKSMMMQLYEGISYEMYLIKTKLHLMIMKWFEISLKHCTLKKQMMKSKQKIFIQRNKLFVSQIQNSLLSQLFFKDFYSNIELILFQVVKQEINNQDYQSAGATIRKTFQILKLQVVELNELLFYLQKKVFKVLTVKANNMIDLFILDAVNHFLHMFSSEKEEFQSTMQNQKWKQLKLNTIWAKYSKIFQKLPNNIQKQHCFQKVSAILQSNSIVLSMSNQMQKIQESKNESESSSSDSESNNQNQSNFSNKSQLIKTKNRQKRRSSFKNMKQDQYEDFINFLIQDNYIKNYQEGPSNLSSKINTENKQEQLNLFKEIFAKAYLKKQGQQNIVNLNLNIQQQEGKQIYPKIGCKALVKTQKQCNLTKLRNVKSNSLSLLQKIKTNEIQKLRHDNPLQRIDLNRKGRSYSMDDKMKNNNKNFKGQKQLSMFINPCKNNEKHFPLNNKASYPKLSKPSNNIYSTKLQLPILLIK